MVQADGGVSVRGQALSSASLKKAAKKDKQVFAVEEGGLRAIKVFSDTTGWVRSLCPTDGAPTTLVGGFPMHRIRRTDPWEDSKSKIAALGEIKGDALDTCAGLGYTAILLAEQADSVLTIDLDEGALEIARQNPWSDRLFSNERIERQVGDAREVLGSRSNAFDMILHDPPSPSLSGDLLSEEFYSQLARVARPGCRLFHYIGDPESALGQRHYPGIMERLKKAGWKGIRQRRESFGVTAAFR